MREATMLAKETAAPGHDSPAQEGTQSNDGNIQRPSKVMEIDRRPYYLADCRHSA